MDRKELEKLWADTLGSSDQTADKYDRLAQSVLDIYESGDGRFRQHIKNRFGRVTEATGQTFDAKNFDLAMARAFVADEIGFSSWEKLIDTVQHEANSKYSLLFHYAIAAMWRGDLSALESMIGPERFDAQIREWYEKGNFGVESETLAEIFSAACMLGYPRTAEYLLDKGVDPYARTRTGLSGFHYAASSGRPEVIRLLIKRKVPMEIRNMYGGTVLGQAIWSAVNEYTPHHAEIVEALIDAGAEIEPGTLEWWNEQPVPSAETKERVAEALERREENQHE